MRRNLYLKIIEINNQTLAGVPSVVFGLLGLTIFVYALHLGESIVATDDESTRFTNSCCGESRSNSISTKCIIRGFLRIRCYEVANDVSNCIAICFPRDYNGLYVSDIKSNWRSAPLLVIGALAFANYVPFSMFDRFTVLPIQIFNWMSRPQEEFQYVARLG